MTLWPTKVLIRDYVCPELNQHLIGLAYKEQEETRINGAFFYYRQKRNIFTFQKDESLRLLASMAFESAHYYMRKSLGEKGDYRLDIVGWPVIQPPGQYIPTHVHVGRHLSCVYYARVPKQTEGMSPRSGNLSLSNPRPCPRDWHVQNDVIFDAAFYPIAVQTGQLVIFPSYLAHEVYPNESKEDRIAFTMDIIVAKPGVEEVPISEQDLLKSYS
jgi:hypothetical protein